MDLPADVVHPMGGPGVVAASHLPWAVVPTTPKEAHQVGSPVGPVRGGPGDLATGEPGDPAQDPTEGTRVRACRS